MAKVINTAYKPRESDDPGMHDCMHCTVRPGVAHRYGCPYTLPDSKHKAAETSWRQGFSDAEKGSVNDRSTNPSYRLGVAISQHQIACLSAD